MKWCYTSRIVFSCSPSFGDLKLLYGAGPVYDRVTISSSTYPAYRAMEESKSMLWLCRPLELHGETLLQDPEARREKMSIYEDIERIAEVVRNTVRNLDDFNQVRCKQTGKSHTISDPRTRTHKPDGTLRKAREYDLLPDFGRTKHGLFLIHSHVTA